MPTTLSRAELIERLARVSHTSWMRQKVRDQGADPDTLDPSPTDHDRERAEDIVEELAKLEII
jgi:hypothetical protein